MRISTRWIAAPLTVLALAGCSSDEPAAPLPEARKVSPSSMLPGGEVKSLDAPPVTTSTTSTAVAASDQPKVVLPRVKKTIEGAVEENLGPCHGRGIAGSATINGRTEYVCGDGTRDYGYENEYGTSSYSPHGDSTPRETMYGRRRAMERNSQTGTSRRQPRYYN